MAALTPCLSNLSTELIILIVSNLRRLEDLQAFIRTSTRNYHLFRENKVPILAATVRNAIPHIILPDAIAACRASDVAKLWWDEAPEEYDTPPTTRESRFFPAQMDFIKQYPERYQLQDTTIHEQSLLLSLYKLSDITDEFVTDFKTRALTRASQQMPWIPSDSHPFLSFEEDTRLRRAFFRFEIYRKLFSNATNIGALIDSSPEVQQRFFKLFPSWEREELLSVQEYLVRLTRESYQRLQEHIVQTISTLARESVQRSEAHGGPLERTSISSVKALMDFGGHEVFQHDIYDDTKRRHQYLAARGLPFLRWLLSLPPGDQISATAAYATYRCRPTLFESLYADRHYLQSLDDRTLHPAEIKAPPSALPNEGWIWAEREHLTTSVEGVLQRYALREIGYVFWSQERLSTAWKLDQTDITTLELRPRSKDDNEPLENYGPTIEERFHDIFVPREVFHSINEGSCVALEESEKMQVVGDDGQFPTPFSEREVELFDIEY